MHILTSFFEYVNRHRLLLFWGVMSSLAVSMLSFVLGLGLGVIAFWFSIVVCMFVVSTQILFFRWQNQRCRYCIYKRALHDYERYPMFKIVCDQFEKVKR